MLKKVLLIDDDFVALMLNRKLIEQALLASEVVTAANGQIALDYYRSIDPDTDVYPQLVFLDLNMPVKDGWDFLEEFNRELSQSFEQTRIVILSSSINPEDLERSKNYPLVTDFIAKPLNIEVLEHFARVVGKQ